MKNSDTNFLPAIYWILCKRLKKRGWLLFLGILCIAPVRGQLKSELNLPRAGDVIIKQQVEYKDPGRAGENVLWDFSRLGNQNEEYDLMYDTIGGVLTGSEHQTMYRYLFSTDSLILLGYENATTCMQGLQPELILKFPVSYNDSSFTCFHNRGRYGDRLQVDIMGTLAIHADSYGLMILPDKDTLTNVLRIKTVKRMVEDLKPLPFNILRKDTVPPPVEIIPADSIYYRLKTDRLVMETETCQWYVYGYRYPVFETIRNWNIINGKSEDYFATAFFYPPQDHYYLETDPENQKIVETQNKGKKENPLEKTTFNAFPNPVGSTLEVEVFIPTEAKIKIQVRSVVNKSVYINENEGKFAPGSYRFQFNVSKLPAGYYLVNIWADNYLLSETILKQ